MNVSVDVASIDRRSHASQVASIVRVTRLVSQYKASKPHQETVKSIILDLNDGLKPWKKEPSDGPGFLRLVLTLTGCVGQTPFFYLFPVSYASNPHNFSLIPVCCYDVALYT